LATNDRSAVDVVEFFDRRHNGGGGADAPSVTKLRRCAQTVRVRTSTETVPVSG
jgi:hypothetical protein